MTPRRLFSFLALLSLLACLATAALWVRSYSVGEGVTLEHFSYAPAMDESERPIFRLWLVEYALAIDAGQIRLARTRSADDMVIFAEGLWSWSADHTPGWSLRRTPPVVQAASGAQVNRLISINRFKFFWGSWDVEGMFPGSVDYVERSVGVPVWFVMLLLSMLPLTWVLRRARAWSRVQNGLCGVCGYDLRGGAGRCPECGVGASRGERG